MAAKHFRESEQTETEAANKKHESHVCTISPLTLKLLGLSSTADLLHNSAGTHHLANVRYLQKEGRKNRTEDLV